MYPLLLLGGGTRRTTRASIIAAAAMVVIVRGFSGSAEVERKKGTTQSRPNTPYPGGRVYVVVSTEGISR